VRNAEPLIRADDFCNRLRKRQLLRIRRTFMLQLMSVGVGGFLGACARFALTKLFDCFWPSFPMGTLASNVLAGFAIGLIMGFERQGFALSNNVRASLVVGLLGGLSTFSAFSMETVAFLETGRYLDAGVNVVLNVGASVAAVIVGLAVAALTSSRLS
jgi:CrcB protein